ncbi:ABC transporter substrate-binding protein [Sphaerisporangium perillae]|uniref:ABC transporter substrate-binding protein n=1 Tax=Sphaerisporangium perillae TaxID=2935860 RepID=UPI00200E7096|nr:ABC transporter substrate-binding protein [Sphaerisporangium perillae]
MRRRTFFQVGMGVGAAAFLAACGNNDKPSPTGLPSAVRVGTMAPYIELAVMQQQHFLEDALGQGVNTSYQPLLSMVPMATAVAGGSIDIGHGNTPVSAIAAGQKIRIVATFERNNHGQGFLVRPDGSVKSLADLKGKKIGQPTAAPSVQLKKVLDKAGLTLDDITILPLEANVGVAGLTRSAVDVYSAFDPYFTQAIADKKAVELDLGDAAIRTYIPVWANADFLAKYPAAVERYLVALEKSIAWIGQNPDETAQLYAKNNKLDVDLAKRILGNRDRKLAVPNDEYLGQLEYEADFQLQQGLIKKKPDWSVVVDRNLALHALSG